MQTELSRTTQTETYCSSTAPDDDDIGTGVGGAPLPVTGLEMQAMAYPPATGFAGTGLTLPNFTTGMGPLPVPGLSVQTMLWETTLAKGLSRAVAVIEDFVLEVERPGSTPTTWTHTLSPMYWESSYGMQKMKIHFITPIFEDV